MIFHEIKFASIGLCFESHPFVGIRPNRCVYQYQKGNSEEDLYNLGESKAIRKKISKEILYIFYI